MNVLYLIQRYIIALVGIQCLSISTSIAQIASIQRTHDPLVLQGSQLPTFLGTNPSLLVAYKFNNGGWTQIPIQIDERVLRDIVTPYGPLASLAGYPPSASNPKILFYSDPTTLVGADNDPGLDSNDELVIMLQDFGVQTDGTFPAQVVLTSGREIKVVDPLGGEGYVYLFQKTGSQTSGAGISYVSYSSNLATTTGFPFHINGTNNENTTISTSDYSWHFSSEWVSDIYKNNLGTNVDILDRHKNFFANGNCSRSEGIFSSGQNAFLCVKAGPLRVIRSYMGAMSGPFTVRTHLFYKNRQDILTDLRVHNIASIYDAMDYNAAANGMMYKNNLNPLGVIVNGVQDVVNAGEVLWEEVRGTPGTLSILHDRITTLVTPGDAVFTSYYDDNQTAPASNCTGDGQAWGTSGMGIVFSNALVHTDPFGANLAAYRTLQTKRLLYSDSANSITQSASNYYNQFTHPLQVSQTGIQTNLTLRFFIQGYLEQSNTMTPVLFQQGVNSSITECDSVTIRLHGAIAPYAILATFNTTVNTQGYAAIKLPLSLTSNAYYISVNHRNALETWSAMPVPLGLNTVYDFTWSASQAYGQNQFQSLNWSFFSGDINQDGSIDAFDYLEMEPNIVSGNFGYLADDLNGDGSVDAFDYLVVEEHIVNGISVAKP